MNLAQVKFLVAVQRLAGEIRVGSASGVAITDETTGIAAVLGIVLMLLILPVTRSFSKRTPPAAGSAEATTPPVVEAVASATPFEDSERATRLYASLPAISPSTSMPRSMVSKLAAYDMRKCVSRRLKMLPGITSRLRSIAASTNAVSDA